MNDKDCKECNPNPEAQDSEALHMPPCFGLDPNCAECCKVLTANNRARWGITGKFEHLDCECHMICVEDVLLICAMDNQYVDIPVCLCDGTASCRGSIVGPFEPVSCEAFVTCASEELQPDCDGVNIRVGFQAVVRCDSTFVVCQSEFFRKCNFYDFFTFPGGEGFPNTAAGRRAFQDIVRKVDGSCLDIDIKKCEIIDTVNPRIRIVFKLVDKLWKHENLLVSAIRPYGGRYLSDRDIVVKREFGPPQRIPECNNEEPV